MKAYLAAPIVGILESWNRDIQLVKDILVASGVKVFDPRDHGVTNAWGMSHEEWGRAIFAQDTLMIKNSDWLVVCDFGRKSTAGTAWEVGYGFGIGKNILQIVMNPKDKSDYSVMIRGCSSNYVTLDDFKSRYIRRETIYKYFKERGKVDKPDITLN